MSNNFSMYQQGYKSSLAIEDLEKQIAHVLTETDFDYLGEKYSGKVRESYLNDGLRYLITSDRLSCFDVIVTAIPFKGQVLNQIAVEWFKKAQAIVPHHLIDVPHPNVMVVRNVEIIPIEVIVRGYITGSAWRDYQAGKAISGIDLPEGLRKSEKLPEVLLTPSTKAEKGEHDEPISESEILARGIVPEKLWSEVREKALALFALGQSEAEKRGLILVDTKYEFGILDNSLVLADEIHTLDSSRYWLKDSYQERFEAGEDPAMLDKEPTRQWLLSQGYQGDGEVPEFTIEHRVKIAEHYISSYERITGKVFEGQVGSVYDSIKNALNS